MKRSNKCIGSTGFQQDPSRSSDYFKQNHRSSYKDPIQKTKKIQDSTDKKEQKEAPDG
jgi:hypothetical protein